MYPEGVTLKGPSKTIVVEPLERPAEQPAPAEPPPAEPDTDREEAPAR